MTSNHIDFRGINDAALRNARSLLPSLIPGGTFRGCEFVARNPTRADRNPGSFSVNYKTGIWRDFASEDGGSDLISLVAYVHGVGQGEAAHALADMLSVDTPKHSKSSYQNGGQASQSNAPKIYQGGDAGPRSFAGELRRHVYLDDDGNPIRIKIKFSTGKFANVYRLIRDGVSVGWQQKKPDDYRAVPYLTRCVNPFDNELRADDLMWPEGERDVDTLDKANLPAFSFGGVGDGLTDDIKQVIANRRLISDRHVVILADNDQVGLVHAGKKAQFAHAAGAASIKVIHFPDLAEKADVTDYFATGGTAETLATLIRDAERWKSTAEESDVLRGPQDQRDIRKHVKSNELVICRASEITPEAISWLWGGRIALGKQTLIAGEPGLGKSQLSTAIIAAVTIGGTWPNGEGQAPRGNAIILSAEDGVADTIVPRLMAAGADLERVHIVSAVRNPDQDSRRTFNLQTDLALLEQKLDLIGDVRLVAIDPVSSYMGAVDSHKNTDVRGVLESVGEMATRRSVAVLGVTHFSKGGGQKAINSFIGSIAFIAAARAAFAVLKDPDDGERRLFLPVKNNLAPMNAGLAFRILQHIVKTPTVDTVASAIGWEDATVTVSADSVLSSHGGDKSPTAKMECERFLEEILSNGWMAVSDIAAEAVAAGLHAEGKEIQNNKSMRSARAALSIITRREGFGRGAKYFWGFAGTPWKPSETMGAQQEKRAPMEEEGAHGDWRGGER
jgi:putative DNA primase/helicase